MLIRVSPRPTRAVNARSAAPARSRAGVQRRGYTAAVSSTTGTLQQIDDLVYGRTEELSAQLKELKSKGQKVGIDKYNEVLGANIFAGNIGGIVDSVNSIVTDGVAPNNTTVRLLNFFFGKTDNFVKGEALIEKLENLHQIPKNAAADINALLPAGSETGVWVPPATSTQLGEVFQLSENYQSEFAGVFSAWHTAKASDKPADKAALKKALAETLKKTLAGDVGTQLAAKLGSEIVPASAFESVKGGKKLTDPAFLAKYQSKIEALQKKLVNSQASIKAVAKYLGSQPHNPGAAEVTFSSLVSYQRVFQNTHGELKKYFDGVRLVALANLLIHGAPPLPEGHPFPTLYLSGLFPPDAYSTISAEVKGKDKVAFVDPNASAPHAVMPMLASHERWFADYYTSNDDLKTY